MGVPPPNPSVVFRDGSMLPSGYADARSPDDVITIEGISLDDLCLTFETEHQGYDGSVTTIGLKPGGSSIKVTEENKAEYIQLFVKHRLVGAIKHQIGAFQGGLGVYFPPHLLFRLRRELSAAEVKVLVCGAPEIDVGDWQASATYLGGFTAASAQVGWFWGIVRGMEIEKRAKLLDFCTGSAQAPATGFAHLMGYSGNQHCFSLQQVDGASDRLPTASTCFNMLSMPAYASAEQLEAKLLGAIDQAQGFDEDAVAN